MKLVKIKRHSHEQILQYFQKGVDFLWQTGKINSLHHSSFVRQASDSFSWLIFLNADDVRMFFLWCERLKINAITFPTFFPLSNQVFASFQSLFLQRGKVHFFLEVIFLSPSSNFHSTRSSKSSLYCKMFAKIAWMVNEVALLM